MTSPAREEWLSETESEPASPKRTKPRVVKTRRKATVQIVKSPRSKPASDMEAPVAVAAPVVRPAPRQSSALDGVLAFTGNVLWRTFGLLFQWGCFLLAWTLSHVLAASLSIGLVAALLFYVWTYMPSLGLRLPSLLGIHVPSVVTPLSYIYCSTVGIGCASRKPNVAKLAKTTANQAAQANDIFQSLIALGDPKTNTLAFSEIWELGVAVSVSSDLPMKEEFGSALKELGDTTRDVSDSLVECVSCSTFRKRSWLQTSINSASLATLFAASCTFYTSWCRRSSWTVHEFNVILKTIQRMQANEGKYTPEDVTRQLDRMLDNLSSSLDDMLGKIEQARGSASRASDIGKQVLVRFKQEERRLRELKEDTPLWRFLLEKNTFKGRQLSRDIDLTSLRCGFSPGEDPSDWARSIENVRTTGENLDQTRTFLRKYRNNIGHFKASVLGFHGSDHALEPAHEVEALSDIMGEFSEAVRKAKQLPVRPGE
jgi:hypothetical protein